MTELDTFDARLARAYRRYLAEAPTSVDAVAMAHTAAGARRPAWRLDWPLVWRPARSLVWLALLGLLLAALIAAAAFVGSHRPALGFACPSGSNPDRPGPAEQARPPLAYVAPMAFDSNEGRVVMVVQSYSDPSPQTWTFDICTNTWQRMFADRESGVRGRLVYDVDSRLTLALGDTFGNRLWAYDLVANTWTEKGLAPGTMASQPRAVYDSASGRVVAQSAASTPTDPWELWTYDVDTDTWTPLAQAGGPRVPPDHAHQLLAYDSTVNRLVSYDDEVGATAYGSQTWLFDLANGSWSRSAIAAPPVNFGWGNSGGEIAYDQAAQRTAVFSYGRMIAYDAAADSWEVVLEGWDPSLARFANGPDRTSRWGPSMVYDSVNQRLVVYGGQYPTGDAQNTWVQSDDVLAFDLITRSWTVLLDTKELIPAPS